MGTDGWAARWRELSEGALDEMQAWRAAHPRATFREIEDAVEERIARLRARMLEDTAHASPAREWATAPPGERPACPECGRPLDARGQATRTVTAPGEQPVRLRRGYGVCPGCGAGLFPPG
jgi:hypothetical protein